MILKVMEGREERLYDFKIYICRHEMQFNFGQNMILENHLTSFDYWVSRLFL